MKRGRGKLKVRGVCDVICQTKREQNTKLKIKLELPSKLLVWDFFCDTVTQLWWALSPAPTPPCASYLFDFSRHGFSVALWPSWNLLQGLDWPEFRALPASAFQVLESKVSAAAAPASTISTAPPLCVLEEWSLYYILVFSQKKIVLVPPGGTNLKLSGLGELWSKSLFRLVMQLSSRVFTSPVSCPGFRPEGKGEAGCVSTTTYSEVR